MSRFSRLRSGETTIQFVERRKTWFAVSAFVVLVSLLSLSLRNGPGNLGLNLSLDFEGGSSVQGENLAGISAAELRSALSGVGVAELRIDELGDGATFRVRTEAVDPDTEARLVEQFAAAVGVDPGDTIFRSVGPTFGEQIAQRALLALGVFLGAVLLFIAWRFEWRMAVGAIGALFHDLIITAGVYSVTGLEVTPSTVVAILTILGYSLYDTVVVYDKISEVEEEDPKLPYDQVVNRSMNRVLMRSINTSLTSLLPVGTILFVGSSLLGAGILTDFALALFVGIMAGTYSSIFIASPIVAAMRLREPREAAPAPKAPEPAPKAADVAQTGTSALKGGQFDSGRPLSSGATPRPPKKRRKR